MISAFAHWRDRLLGRGDAACTVPVFDGPLTPNARLDAAQRLYPADDGGAEAGGGGMPRESWESWETWDLAGDGRRLWLAHGPRLLQIHPDGRATECLRAEGPITALAAWAGGVAYAVDGRLLRVWGGRLDGLQWHEAAGQPFVALNALSVHRPTDAAPGAAAGPDTPDGPDGLDGPDAPGALIATDGSRRHGPMAWQHDLMAGGANGREARGGRVLRLGVERVDRAGGGEGDGGGRGRWRPRPPELLADGLHHAFGALAHGSAVWASESWRHRVVALGAGDRPVPVLSQLPGYPSRLAPARAGGAWLTVFATRTQLVEFVLREPAYRQRMVATMPPALWVAPQIRAGQSFLEPLQGGGIKQMGVLKPWAPPRAYGLVLRLGPDGRVRHALHSRVDGRHHGIVAALEQGDDLLLLSAGARRVLRLPLAQAEQAVMEEGG